MSQSLVEMVFRLFEVKGREAYFGEPVSQSEHALQCALAAEQAGSDSALIVSALLHDIGHLLSGDEAAADEGYDARHEQIGAQWLFRQFGLLVSEPVRMHVPAKRYLCAIDPSYLGTLSPASVLSQRLQGGPMTDDEVIAFSRNPLLEQAVALRRWDDAAKVPGLPTPDFEYYRPHLDGTISRANDSNRAM